MKLPAKLNFASLKGPYVKKVIGYSLFLFAAIIFLIVVRFPTDSLTPFIQRTVSDNMPFKVVLSESHFTFPPALKLMDITLIEPLPTKNRELITIESLIIRPSFFSTVFGNPAGSIFAKMLGGELAIYGKRKKDDAGKSMQLTFTASDINVGQATIWNEFPWGKIDGKINGDGELYIPAKKPEKLSEGKIALQMGESVLQISKAILSSNSRIPLSSGEFQLSIKSGVVSIEKGEIKGQDIKISVTGTIVTAQSLPNSKLNLIASIRLKGDLKKQLGIFTSFFKKDKTGATTIKIGGTLASPATR